MKLIFTILFSCACLGVFGQLTEQTTTGDWGNAVNWDNGVADQLSETATIGQNVTSTIVNGEDYTIGNLTMDKAVLNINTGATLTVGSMSQPGVFQSDKTTVININGDFIIYGAFIVENNLTLNITGNLIIKGDIEVKNNAVFTVAGNMVVEGDFVGNNNAEFYVDGSIDVGGDLDVGTVDVLEFGPDGSFTVGGTCTSATASFCQALPVDLIYFAALSVEEGVVLRWSTATEINNDYFTLQVSGDGSEYRDIARIEGAGTSSSMRNYQYTDASPVSGTSYYRLKQTDFNGVTVNYWPIRVDRDRLQQPLVYPNPVERGDRLTVYTGGTSGDAVDISVMNLQGRVVLTRSVIGVQHEMEISDNLSPGVYIIRLSDGIRTRSYRLVVE